MSAPSLAPLQMTLRAEDGLLLRGELRYPGGPPEGRWPLAVLAHQWPATRDAYAPLVEDFLQAGIATLAFDHRGHGASTKGVKGRVVIEMPDDFSFPSVVMAFSASAQGCGFAHMPNDVLRVANWGVLQNFIDGSRVVLVGSSVGGSAVLVAAPSVPGLRAVVTLGAAGAPAFGADGPTRVRRSVEATKAPVWMATSDEDPFDGANNARNWGKGLAHVRARFVPGDAHAMAIYYAVREELLETVTAAL